jgi:hypothetical protein
MILHCAGRLGILSWIYEQRQMIAYELDLIDEKPIAECGTGYLDSGLVIIQQDDSSQAQPSIIFNGKEINLFVVYSMIEISKEIPVISIQHSELIENFPPGSTTSIFHPPSLA